MLGSGRSPGGLARAHGTRALRERRPSYLRSVHRIPDDAPEGNDMTTSAGSAAASYQEPTAAVRGDPIMPGDPGHDDAPQAEQPETGRRRWAVLAVVSAAQFLIILDLWVVNIALPALQHDFAPATLSDVSWTSAARPPRPGTAKRRLARAGRHPEAGKMETARFAGRGPAPGLFHASATGAGPPAGPASAPCPCHESRRSSGQAPSPGPYPNRPRSSASVADRSSGPTAATPSAVLRPPAMAVPYAAAGSYPLAHPVHTTRNPRNAAVIWL